MDETNEYRLVAVDPTEERGKQGFVAKIVTEDFDGDAMDVCYFEDESEGRVVCDTLNEALADTVEAVGASGLQLNWGQGD